MKKIISAFTFLLPFICFAQGGSEIYLFDLKVDGGKISVSNPQNITNHKGYDNQPHFAGNTIYYVSDVDTLGHTDIKTYNCSTKQTAWFVNTKTNEYSPTLTPDKNFISCIIATDLGKPGATQFLGKYPVKGGDPVILINNRVVGYHAWMDNNRLLLFILDDSIHQSLRYYNLATKEEKIIIQKPGRSLHKIPGQNAMSFVDKTVTGDWRIKKIDCTTMDITDLTATIPAHEDMAWTANGQILMSDGTKLFSYQPGSDQGWQLVMDTNPMLKGITRMTVNGDNSKLAIVVRE